MVQILGLVLISFLVTSFIMIPFIDWLFILRERHIKNGNKNINKKENLAVNKSTPIHNLLLKGKDIHTPVGGGIPIILVVVTLTVLILILTNHTFDTETYILIFTMLAFGFIGFMDDLRKMFVSFSGKYSGIRGRYIFVYQLFFALLVSLLLYFPMGINNIFIPVLGNVILGWLYIPLAVFSIIAFTNAYNISDGLDGLSTGLLIICLFAFLVLAHTVFDETLSTFIGIWIGA